MNATRNGIVWTGIEKILVYGACFVQGVILARLLGPEDFGLTAMLGIFLGIGSIFAESGLGTALVVCKEGWGWKVGKRILKWNIGIAAVLYLILAGAAPGIAAWYGKPILAPLMLVMALGLIVNSASVVATAWLTQTMSFGKLAWVNGGSSVAGATVAIGLACLGCGVWSIAGMGLVQAVVRTSLAWWLARAVLTGSCETEPVQGQEFKDLLGYGWKLMASGVVHTIYLEISNLIIGKMWSPAAVGLFVRGNRWARLPGEVVNEAVGRVALPRLASEKDAGIGKRWLWIRFVGLNCLLLWPGLAVLLVFAPEIVGFVLGPKWLDCVPYMRILLVGQFLTPIWRIALLQIFASGHSELVLKTDMWKKPIALVVLACAIPFGVEGLCWAMVLGEIVEIGTDLIFVSHVRKGVQ